MPAPEKTTIFFILNLQKFWPLAVLPFGRSSVFGTPKLPISERKTKRPEHFFKQREFIPALRPEDDAAKKNPILLLMAAAVLLLPSCYATRTSVGGYRKEVKEENARIYTYAKGKQVYLLWGLIPLGRTSVSTPADGKCEIRTRHGFGDAIVSLITGGIISMQTIKVVTTHDAKTGTAAPQPETETE